MALVSTPFPRPAALFMRLLPRRKPKGVLENVRSSRHARPRRPTGGRGGPDPDGAEHRAPGPGRLGAVTRPARGGRVSPTLHPGPEPRPPPAHVVRRSPAPPRPQLRALQ